MPQSSAGQLARLDAGGLQRFEALRREAVEAVTERFYATHGADYEQFGARGRQACREDLDFHLEFLRPVLEFGLLAPMVDYLRWLATVLATRDVPTGHLALSLDWLAEFFAARLAGKDKETVVAALEDAKGEFLRRGPLGAETLTPPPPAWPESAPFEVALLAGDRREAHAVVDGCLAAGRSLVDIEMHVIQPAMFRIGEKWQRNEVSVAQEHLATAIAQSVMTAALSAVVPAPLIDRKVLLACVDGNNHVLGMQMVGDAFQLAGWDVQYLGASVPTAALVQQVAAWQPELVGLSVSLPHQLRHARQAIVTMRERLGESRPAMMIGGLAINQFRALAAQLGADEWCIDARAAVESANRMPVR